MEDNMSLNYGNPRWMGDQWAKVPEPIRQVHHNIMPWTLMACGIPCIVPSTIPVLLERWQLIDSVGLQDVRRYLNDGIGKSLEEVLQDWFIGFDANVPWEPNAKWSKRVLRVKTPKTGAEIAREYRQTLDKLDTRAEA
jgi:hypothetical protein